MSGLGVFLKSCSLPRLLSPWTTLNKAKPNLVRWCPLQNPEIQRMTQAIAQVSDAQPCWVCCSVGNTTLCWLVQYPLSQSSSCTPLEMSVGYSSGFPDVFHCWLSLW